MKVDIIAVQENPPVPVELDTVQQREEAPIAISVRHDGPLSVLNLPARNAVAENWTFPTAANQTEIGRFQGDRRRAKLTLIATDKPFIVGESRAKVAQGRGAVWPINVPLIITHIDDVYIACFSSTPTDVSTVSSVEEFWAD